MFLLLLACASSFSGFTVAPLETMPTVLEVFWENTGADAAWVEYGDGQRAEPEADSPEGQYRILVPGFPQGTEVKLQPMERWGDEEVASRVEDAETGYLPSGLPLLELTEDNAREIDDGWLLTTALGEKHGVMVLNREGEIVWYLPMGVNLVAPDVEPLRGGKGFVVFTSAADHVSDLGELQIFGYDGLLIQKIRAQGGHHMFEQPAPGLFAFLSLDLREVEGQTEPVVGDSIRLVDQQGNDNLLFTVWDYFTFDPNFDSGNFYPDGLDWMHANGLHWSESRQTLMASYRMFDSVVEVDFTSGQPVDMYGRLGERPFSPVGSNFLSQHAPSWTPDGDLMVFDNREPFTEGSSRAAEYAVGDALELVWEHAPLPGTVVTTLGDAKRLPNGNTLMSFGSSGGWQEVNPEGEVVWQVLGGAGVLSGNVAWMESW